MDSVHSSTALSVPHPAEESHDTPIDGAQPFSVSQSSAIPTLMLSTHGMASITPPFDHTTAVMSNPIDAPVVAEPAQTSRDGKLLQSTVQNYHQFSSDDDEDGDDNFLQRIPAGQSIMDYLSSLSNLSQMDRGRLLSRVGVKAKRNEIAIHVGIDRAKDLNELEIKQMFNQLDNWKFSLINFPSTAAPRFIQEAQKQAKRVEKRKQEGERRKAEEERKRTEKERKKLENEKLEKKRKREGTDKKGEAEKENRNPANSNVRSKRKCAAATQRKIKEDAEAEVQSEVKIVSDVRDALKELSDFEASSESSSDDEWTEKRLSGRKNSRKKNKKKGKNKQKYNPSKKTILFRHDPTHNPFIPPKPKEEIKAEEFEGFDDVDIQQAAVAAREAYSKRIAAQESSEVATIEDRPHLPVQLKAKREILIEQERRFTEALMNGMMEFEEFQEPEGRHHLQQTISDMTEEMVSVLKMESPKLDELAADDGGFKEDDAAPEEISSDDVGEDEKEEAKDAVDGVVARNQRSYARLIGSVEAKPRPLRKAASTIKNYIAPDYSDEEEEEQLLVPCTWCPEPHQFGICPTRPDKLPNYIPNRVVDDASLSKMSRAEASLPENLSIKESRIAGADLGVWYKYNFGSNGVKFKDKTPLPRGTIFGPYEGRILSSEEEADRSGTAWEVRLSNGDLVFVDGNDDAEANWLKYVNCSRTAKEQNLYAFDFKGAIYYLVIRNVLPSTELLVYYGDAYANTLNIYTAPNPDKTDLMHCHVCDAYFRCSEDLSRHLESAHECWPCQHCNYVGNSQKNLCEHVRRSHAIEYKFHCQDCDYKTNNAGHLEYHRRVHDKKRPFVCPTCGKGFTQAAHLRDHERIHTGERPYKCEQCGKDFNKSSHINKHKRTVHDKQVGKHKCEICGKRCGSAYLLESHVRVHTGEKPFKCSVCDLTFSEANSRRRHEKNIHKLCAL